MQRLFLVNHRAYADFVRMVCGNHDEHASRWKTHLIVLPLDTIHLTAYNGINDSGAVHRVHDLVAYSIHGSHLPVKIRLPH